MSLHFLFPFVTFLFSFPLTRVNSCHGLIFICCAICFFTFLFVSFNFFQFLFLRAIFPLSRFLLVYVCLLMGLTWLSTLLFGQLPVRHEWLRPLPTIYSAAVCLSDLDWLNQPSAHSSFNPTCQHNQLTTCLYSTSVNTLCAHSKPG